MGQHASSIKQVVQEEFSRFKGDDPRQKDDEVNLEKFRDINQPESPYYISLEHLGVLYCVDQNKNGLFSLKEIEAFIDNAATFSQKCSPIDFRKKFQGYCSLCMWKEIEETRGRDNFVDWVLHVIKPCCIKQPIVVDGRELWHISAASCLHDLFCVRDTQRLTVQEFTDMLQTDVDTGYGLGPEQDNRIPTRVIQEVVLDVLDGMASLVHEVFLPGEVEHTLNAI